MYIPEHFEETRIEVMHELIRQRPLATLVTLTSQGLVANHIPLHLTDTPAPLGTLRGHVARANPLWQEYQANVNVLAVFHGPDSYISPSWYASKADTGKGVPTWNYAVVHASGSLRVIEDPAWLRTQLELLTEQNEQHFAEPWAVADAPSEYTKKLIAAIVGIEIEITCLTGKWKTSQNQSAPNREGVIAGLECIGKIDSAEMIKQLAAD
jgi:transcriptional regulator